MMHMVFGKKCQHFIPVAAGDTSERRRFLVASLLEVGEVLRNLRPRRGSARQLTTDGPCVSTADGEVSSLSLYFTLAGL